MQKIRQLEKKYPNDQEFGAKIRQYLNENKICCSEPSNLGEYIDRRGNSFPQCKECGKLLI